MDHVINARMVLTLWEVIAPVSPAVLIAPLAAIALEIARSAMLGSNLPVWIAPPAPPILSRTGQQPVKTAPLAAMSAMPPTALAPAAMLASNLTAILARLVPLTPTAREAT
jgi:hypothetical protein